MRAARGTAFGWLGACLGVALAFSCAAVAPTLAPSPVTVRADVVASQVRVMVQVGATTATQGDSVALVYSVGALPGVPAGPVRRAFPVGPARADSIRYPIPEGYSVTGVVGARFVRAGGFQGPEVSRTWEASNPMTATVPGFTVRADTLP